MTFPFPSRICAEEFEMYFANKTVLLVSHVRTTGLNGGTTYTRSVVAGLRAQGANDIHELYVRGEYSPWTLAFYKLANIFLSVFTPLPAPVMGYFSFYLLISCWYAIAKYRVDVVILDHTEMFWLAGLIPRRLIRIGIVHNDEVAIYRQKLERLPAARVLKSVIKREVNKYSKWAVSALSRLDSIICISMLDAKAIQASNVAATVNYVPPRFRVISRPQLKSLRPDEKLIVGFLGDAQWMHNASGIIWFNHHVLPHLRPQIEIWIVGRRNTTIEVSDDRVKYWGYMDSLETLWNGAHLMIAPIFSGAGANVKIAEYLAHAMPLITTPFCAAPYGLTSDDCFISDEPAAWANYINSQIDFYQPVRPCACTIAMFCLPEVCNP